MLQSNSLLTLRQTMKALDTNEPMRATLKEHTTSTDQYSIVPTSGARSMSAFHAIAQFLIATNRLEDERDPLHIKLRDDLKREKLRAIPLIRKKAMKYMKD